MVSIPSCPKSKSGMEQGFIADEAYGAVLVSKWVDGLPEKVFGRERRPKARSSWQSSHTAARIAAISNLTRSDSQTETSNRVLKKCKIVSSCHSRESGNL